MAPMMDSPPLAMAGCEDPSFLLASLSTDIHNEILQLSQKVKKCGDEKSNRVCISTSQGLEWQSNANGINISRERIIGMLEQMKRLLYDPTDFLKEITQGHSLDLGVVRALVQLKIPASVPLDKDAHIGDIAQKIAVDETTLTRLFAYAETMGLFRFTSPDKNRVAHTHFSAGLVHGVYADLATWDVAIPPFASIRLSEALKKNGNCDGPDRAPFKLGLETEENFYEWHKNNPEYGKLFHMGMASEEQDFRTSPQNIVRAFDWNLLAHKRVVDLGGSTGHVAKMICESYPDIEFVVQDLPEVISAAEISPEHKILFMGHDFFSPQACVADAYLLRYILHNWTEQDCIRILQALRPALRPGAKLLVAELLGDNELISPETWVESRLIRRRDMQMMTYIGASERTPKGYDELVKKADPAFRFDGYHKAAGSLLAIFEWTYTGAESEMVL